MDSKLPIVSVGIPTYNRPEGLRRTLNAITSQTYPNLEIIISDNCSDNENVSKVIEAFATRDNRIISIKQNKNIGAFNNFKFVLQKSTGTFFMWAADDDWMDLNYIDKCVDILKDNKDYAGAYGLSLMHDNNGNLLKKDTIVDLTSDIPQFRVLHYYKKVTHNGCFYGVMRRSFLSQVTVTSKLAGDWLMVAQLVIQGKYKMVENTNYHISSGGVSQTIDNLTLALKSPPFTRAFPYLTIAINAVWDILWNTEAYGRLKLSSRLKLALSSFLVIVKRYKVKAEIKNNYKKFIRLKSNQIFGR